MKKIMILANVFALLTMIGCNSTTAAPPSDCSAYLNDAPIVLGQDTVTCVHASSTAVAALGMRVDRPSGERFTLSFGIDKVKMQQATSYDLPVDGLRMAFTDGPLEAYTPGATPGLCITFNGSMYFEDLENDYAVFFNVTCTSGPAAGRVFNGWLHGKK